MKTPQVPAMPWRMQHYAALRVLNDKAQDEKTTAERQWQSRKLAPAPQKPCDHGLFSDDAKQLDLMEKCK